MTTYHTFPKLNGGKKKNTVTQLSGSWYSTVTNDDRMNKNKNPMTNTKNATVFAVLLRDINADNRFATAIIENENEPRLNRFT